MQTTCWNMTFPGELENDVDGSFLYGFKLLDLCLCKGVVPYWCPVFKYRSYDCNIEMEEMV